MNIEAFVKNQQKINTVPRFNRKYLMDNWESVGKTFKANFQKDALSDQIINFFCKEREEYYPQLIENPKKGLCIHGHKGLGKTLNFLIYQRMLFLNRNRLQKHVYEKQCNKIYNTPSFFHLEDIQETQLKYKADGVKRYEFLRSKPELVIDDVGTEALNNKDFGTDIDLVSDLIRLRYNQMQKNFFVTHMTTNLVANTKTNQIRERYGDRITDRMNEMFIYILAEGESKRL